MGICMPVHAKVASVGSIDCATKVIHIIIIEPRHGNPTFRILEKTVTDKPHCKRA